MLEVCGPLSQPIPHLCPLRAASHGGSLGSYPGKRGLHLWGMNGVTHKAGSPAEPRPGGRRWMMRCDSPTQREAAGCQGPRWAMKARVWLRVQSQPGQEGQCGGRGQR